jgi:hypothetical protein
MSRDWDGTEIRVKGTGWSRADRARLREEIQSRLRFAPADLDLQVDGEPVETHGLQPPDARGVTALCGPDATGAVGFAGEHLAAGLIHVVMDGVLVETVREPTLLPGLVAVVGAPDLAADLSQRKVVQNHAWRRVQGALSEAAGDALKAFVAELFPTDATNPHGFAVTDAVARACLGRAPAGARADLPEPWNRLARLRLFPTIDGGCVSLEDVRQWYAEEATVRYAGVTLARACLESRVVQERLADPARILLLSWPMQSEEGVALARLGDEALTDVTERLLDLPRDRAALRRRLA